jgi:hypothetical protein
MLCNYQRAIEAKLECREVKSAMSNVLHVPAFVCICGILVTVR